MNFRYVFGPVSSGRLGRSLGLDMTGAEICTQDCLYCEAGPTRVLTRVRKPYVRAAAVLRELARWRDEVGAKLEGGLDVVTLGGMGEPALNAELAQVITGVRQVLPGVDVAVLTNATELTDPRVRAEMLDADLILPSVDSLVEEEFQALCRPAPGITAKGVAEGILALRKEFTGRIRLEVLLAAGVNDSDANLQALTAFVEELKPGGPLSVDVVTVTRPPAHGGAEPVSKDVLERFRTVLGSLSAPAGTKTGRQTVKSSQSLTNAQLREMVLRSVRRRPQTVAELAVALDAPPAGIRAHINKFLADGTLVPLGTGPEPPYGPPR